MKNINNNLIIYSLILLAFLMLGATVIALMPQEAKADVVESDYINNSGMRNVTYSYDTFVEPEPRPKTVPENNNVVSTTPTKTTPAPTTTTTKKATTTPAKTSATTTKATTSEDLSSLAAGAIFGNNGFMPSGIVQWLLLAIFILLIMIIVRKIYGEKQYHESPLKHA